MGLYDKTVKGVTWSLLGTILNILIQVCAGIVLARLLEPADFGVYAMAFAIFDKYNINDFQGELFKRKNKPNPIFISEMKNLIKHFIWNWDEYLQKNKLKF